MNRSTRLLAGFFTLAGSMHFIRPRAYEAIMPPYVPAHREAVRISGVAELLGGLAVVPRATRPAARWWLLALLVAVFPANVHMALNAEEYERDVPGGEAALWGRLPIQAVFIAWAYAAG